MRSVCATHKIPLMNYKIPQRAETCANKRAYRERILWCTYNKDSGKVPERDEMLLWLQQKSGLSDEYYEKIKHVRYLDSFGLTVTFNRMVNCFVAMRQMKNRKLRGRRGNFEIDVVCPCGTFRNIVMFADEVLFCTQTQVIDAFKEYGDVVEIYDTEWFDMTKRHYLPDGCVIVCILVIKQFASLPKTSNIGGVDTSNLLSFCDHELSEDLLTELWNNRVIHKRYDNTQKIFQWRQKNPGNAIEITYDVEPKCDLRDWFVRNLAVCEEYKHRILTFKRYSDSHYEIVFNDTVNCLYVAQEIKFDIINSKGPVSLAKIKCKRGEFVNVTVLSNNTGMKLTEKVVQNTLEPYGVIMAYELITIPQLHEYCIKFSFETVRCRMFKTTDIPKQLKLNGYYADVTCTPREKKSLCKQCLDNIWNASKTLNAINIVCNKCN